jgi:hypothetical protein
MSGVLIPGISKGRVGEGDIANGISGVLIPGVSAGRAGEGDIAKVGMTVTLGWKRPHAVIRKNKTIQYASTRFIIILPRLQNSHKI